MISIQYITHKGEKIRTTLPLHTCQYHLEDLHIDCQYTQQRWQLQLTATAPITLKKINLQHSINIQTHDRILCNGFQSWSETREYSPQERIAPMSLLLNKFASPMGDYDLYRYPFKKGILHTWTYTYCKKSDASYQFFGSLAEHSGYTLFVFDANKQHLSVRKDCKNRCLQTNETWTALDIYTTTDTETKVFAVYRQLLFPQNITVAPPIAGWTSWYMHYTKISEKIVRSNLQAFQQRKIPIHMVQIDDGWQQAVGDWTAVNNKFPSGLALLVDSIHAAGYQAGLWLAPFVCTRQSNIFKHHRDWLLHSASGKLVTAGYNALWKSDMYVLDFYHDEVRQYLALIFRTLLQYWKFDLLKIDFLYAVALQPPAHKTRGEVMYEALAWLRKLAAAKQLLACGVPLGAAFGQVDYCRIGADVHLAWEFDVLHRLRNRERVSTHNALRSTLYNRHLNQLVFGNDPDVAILRANRHQLSPKQQETLWLMNQIFGSVQFISDHIDSYTADTLQRYLAQFPLQNKSIDSVTTIGSAECYDICLHIGMLQYRCYSNWSAEQQTVELLQNVHYFDCMEHRFETSIRITLAPYQSVLYLCSPINSDDTIILGSCGALFAGSEVADLDTSGERIGIKLLSSLPYRPTIYLSIAPSIRRKMINDQWHEIQVVDGLEVLIFQA